MISLFTRIDIFRIRLHFKEHLTKKLCATEKCRNQANDSTGNQPFKPRRKRAGSGLHGSMRGDAFQHRKTADDAPQLARQTDREMATNKRVIFD
jgi:hypothetical protein